MMIREPDRVIEKERFFQYWWEEIRVFFGGYLGGFFGYAYPLHIYPDENSIVKNFEIKKKGLVAIDPGGYYKLINSFLELYAGKYVKMGAPNVSEIGVKGNGKDVWRVPSEETFLDGA